MDLTNEDVADVLALLDSLPYDELDLQTTRFRLTLRRTPDGWTQSAQVLSEPNPLEPVPPPAQATAPSQAASPALAPSPPGPVTSPPGPATSPPGPAAGSAGSRQAGGEISGAGRGQEADGGLVAVRAPLPGTFYRAPRPGAPPFVEVGSRVSADTVIGIVETMKLMNSVPAGTGGTVAEICLGNAEFAAHGATLVRIRADP